MNRLAAWTGIFIISGMCAWALSELPARVPDIMVDEEATLLSERTALERRVSELENELSLVLLEAEEIDVDMEQIKDALEAAEQIGGGYDMTGPGVEVILSDARPELRGENAGWSIVHDADMLAVLNALVSAGAECVSVNDVRILANTRIRCGGPTIHVRDRRLTPPFVINAIGEPDSLLKVFDEKIDGGASLREQFAAFGLTFNVTARDSVVVKRSLTHREFRYARPVEVYNEL